jgi:16S rRNA (cytosine967-C5)-methyltransferase
MNHRAIATTNVLQVLAGKSLGEIDQQVIKNLLPRDHAFIQAMTYGVCRWYQRLEVISRELLHKPLSANDEDLRVLILVGLYQLTAMRVPAHAAVAETVAAVESFNKNWAKGLVNAVLRNYQRQAAVIDEKLLVNPVAQYSHPTWLIKKISQDWPQHWQEILTANNAHPPFAIRVNTQKISRDAYLPQLESAAIIPETLSGIVLAEPLGVTLLPGFEAGEVSVQDGAAQLAAVLLQVQPGQRVLDACAAPGGKTAHLLELQPKLKEFVAIDKDATRLAAVRANLTRLSLVAKVIHADAGEPAKWWDGQLFGRILLDAPCTASGVIRRHPDIKLLRRKSDIAARVREQLHLLSTLWDLLEDDGLLLYATCSIFPDENVGVLTTFLATHADALEDKITASWGIGCTIGRQILPGSHGMDGFYFARLRKCSNRVS